MRQRKIESLLSRRRKGFTPIMVARIGRVKAGDLMESDEWELSCLENNSSNKSGTAEVITAFVS